MSNVNISELDDEEPYQKVQPAPRKFAKKVEVSAKQREEKESQENIVEIQKVENQLKLLIDNLNTFI